MEKEQLEYNIILKVAQIFDIPVSLNNIIASTSGFKNLSATQIIILGLEKFGINAELKTKRTLRSIDQHSLPCLAGLKNGEIVVLQETIGDEVCYIDQHDKSHKVQVSTFKKLFDGRIILLKTSTDSIQTSILGKTKTTENWLFSTLYYFKDLYTKTILASFFSNLLSLALPLYAMNVYDRVIPNSSENTLLVLTLGIVIAIVFDFLLKNVKSYFIDFANQNTDIILSYKLINKILHSRLKDRTYLSGSLAGYMRDMEIIREYLSSITINALLDIPFAVLFLILLAYIGGFYILMVCVSVILLVVFSSFVVKALSEKYSKDSFFLNNQKTSFLVESLLGLETIKLNLAEKKIQAAWDRISEHHAKAMRSNHSIYSLSTNLITFLQSLNYILVVVFGVSLFFENQISVGALVACMIISTRAVQPFSQASILLMRFNSVKASYKELNAIMLSNSEQSFDTKYLPKYSLDGSIKFENVSFEYDEGKPVLADVSFEIKPKDKIAIVGVIGSGKTTISKLIMGLYQQSKGNIYVDNFHLSQIHPYDLRANVGYVPQDIFLFNGTIMENILLNPLVKVDSKEGLKTAIKVSGIDYHFGGKEDGLNTHVGEGGKKVSGGQKQAIAIARAFANNPPVILMDEPLSMMDKMTSYQFLTRLKEYTEDKTLIIISHQLSVLNIVDKVMYMDNGTITFFGSKDDFLNKFNFTRGS